VDSKKAALCLESSQNTAHVDDDALVSLRRVENVEVRPQA
jgi:hypothetical protein